MKSNRCGKNQTIHHPAQAFTLVEMLLVLVVLGILAAIVYPNLAKYPVDSRVKAAKVQIAALGSALGAFQIENGHFPSSSGGLKDLVQRPKDAPDWRAPYMERIPQDPWGHDYIYVSPGKHNVATFDLMSMGPDGQAGTADDIGNWE